MGGADKIGSILHGHRPAVDIVRPCVADPLLALQIVFRHALHGNRGVFKMIHLSPEGTPAFKAGVENDKKQYCCGDDHVYDDDDSLFHARLPYERPGPDCPEKRI